MADQTIQGTLDVEGPGKATPFNVLTVNAQSFGNTVNWVQSYFIIAKDIGSAPPNGDVRFSVRGDGLVKTRSIETAGTINITGPSSASPFNVLTVDAGSFGVPANLTRSNFIIARDIGANSVVFSVRGDGLLTTSGPIVSPTITLLQNEINTLQGQIAGLQGQIQGLQVQIGILETRVP